MVGLCISDEPLSMLVCTEQHHEKIAGASSHTCQLSSLTRLKESTFQDLENGLLPTPFPGHTSGLHVNGGRSDTASASDVLPANSPDGYCRSCWSQSGGTVLAFCVKTIRDYAHMGLSPSRFRATPIYATCRVPVVQR